MLKKISTHPVFKFVSNRYVLTLLIFLIWMLFFDENSYFNHREINQDIEALEKEKANYKKEIEKDNAFEKDINDPEKLEKFAREEYQMKKENEDVYVIEFDSINH